MKKVITLCFIIVMLVSYGQSKATNIERNKPVDVSEIFNDAENLIDKEVRFKGWVSHVCSHSGRRCFLKSEDGSVSIRVEAAGKIESFNKELTGEQLEVKGTMKIKKLTEQYLDECQEKVKQKDEDIEDGGEHCSAELNNIREMRDWMKENRKDYYPIYFVEGISYSVINE